MKYLYLALLFITCCVSVPRRVPATSRSASVVQEISAETVALVAEVEDGVIPFCTGVWVAQGGILTAAHCAKAMTPDGADPRGVLIAYIVQSEVTGHYTAPKQYHGAVVVKIDEAHDLALLSTVDVPPKHRVARLSAWSPSPGDKLHCVGQDRGFWTYVAGYASQRWEKLNGTEDKVGPWLLVTAPVSNGMSGSGAFTESGELVGVLSLVSSVPNVAIYIHLDTVRAFLS